MGFNLLEFYEYTLTDIKMILTTKMEADNIASKSRMIDIYNTACTNAIMVGSVLSGKQFPKIEKIFPDIYTEDELAEILKKEFFDYLTQFAAANNIKVQKD